HPEQRGEGEGNAEAGGDAFAAAEAQPEWEEVAGHSGDPYEHGLPGREQACGDGGGEVAFGDVTKEDGERRCHTNGAGGVGKAKVARAKRAQVDVVQMADKFRKHRRSTDIRRRHQSDEQHAHSIRVMLCWEKALERVMLAVAGFLIAGICFAVFAW